uniref:ATPase AAA-type core domain-containing protein n=1 Tax=Tanacetum cinerariifolium TaxID=118510 RepID=A0A699KMV5_TANCI|nr:hypothetical protein [Tanacetum cinerariifolium]
MAIPRPPYTGRHVDRWGWSGKATWGNLFIHYYIEHAGELQQWNLSELTLGLKNLIVGRNSTGKSRTLNIIGGLARNLSTPNTIPLAANYVVQLTSEAGEDYIYELQVSGRTVSHERLLINGKVYLSRGEGGAGEIWAEKINGGVMMVFQAPPQEVALLKRRDSIQHSFIEPIFQWANQVRHYNFGSTLGKDNVILVVPNGPEVDERDQNQVTGLFRSGLKEFGKHFLDAIINDAAEVGYYLEDIKTGAPISIQFEGAPGELATILVKERDIATYVDQISMSQGMYRVIAILIHMNFLQFKKLQTCILIDDIGEGLDFERSCRIIDVLRRKSDASQVQLIMSTNDRFVMNEVPLKEWIVLQRKGSAVTARNYKNSKAEFDKFRFTGLKGASEMLFVERLVSEVAELKDIVITKKKIRGGGKSGKHPKVFKELDAERTITEEKFFILIYDCGGDHLVAQRIKEEHKNLTESGYEKIVGIRDVRPSYEREEIAELQQGMEDQVDKGLAPVVFILSAMEVEAWFLAEYSHFVKIHPDLTPELISESLGFNPRTFTASDRDHPARDLEQAYLLKGVVYDKTAVQDTVNVLDFAIVYEELVGTVPELKVLSDAVDHFLTQ